MAINSTRSNAIISKSFSYQELTTLLPSTANAGLYNYINSSIGQGLSKNQILSSARYLSYIQSYGWSTYTLNGTTYAIKTITSTGNFVTTPFSGSTCEVLLVAGGGAGGINNIGGGGGAGGLVYRNNFLLPISDTTVTIGAGGSSYANGTNSVFHSLTALGGGSGNRVESNGGSVGYAGGSGGGGAYGSTGGAALQPSAATIGFGNAGGNGAAQTGVHSVGGGGGAGGLGISGNNSFAKGGDGGIGIAYDLSGTSSYYAGGGGGGSWSGGYQSYGGLGGGGNGRGLAGGTATPGTANTGGGGGGDSSVPGQPGGSGICIVRVSIVFPTSFGS